MRYSHYYVRVQERNLCMTGERLDTSKCRCDHHPSSMHAELAISKLVAKGYERVHVREFKKLLV